MEHAWRDRLVSALRRMTAWHAAVRAYEDLRGITRHRELEEELAEAHELIAELRLRLADATRPPTQFARMRQREAAVGRFARLRLADPRSRRSSSTPDRVRDLTW